MAHDVFVSYSSRDKATADAIVASLEANGIRCWIAPRDILPGSDWGEAIVEAIEQAGTMVLVFSAHSNTSPQIRREIEGAVAAGIPLIPFRIEEVLPCKSLQYFIGPQHWLDAWTPPLEQHLHRLTATIQALLSKRIEGFDATGKEPRLKPQSAPAVGALSPESAESPAVAAREEPQSGTGPSLPRKWSRTLALILVSSLGAAAVGGGVVWWLTDQPAGPKIAEKTMEATGKEPALPVKPPPVKEAGPPGGEPPGAPTKAAVEKFTAEDYVKKGQEAKDWQEKIVFYSKAIELNPQNAEAYNDRGNAYFDKKYYEMALSDYNNAIAINRNNANPYNNRGRYYLVKKQFNMALKDFETAISLNPKIAVAYVNRGAIYFEQNNIEAALKDFNKAIELNQNLAPAYHSRGSAYYRKKEYDKALEDHNRAIEIDPNYVDAYVNRGVTYVAKKQYIKALQNYNKAIELDKNCAYAYLNRGNIYFAKKEYDKALQDFDRAIEIDENFAYPYYHRGLVYVVKKQYTKALEDYDKAIELNPNDQNLLIQRDNLFRMIR
jgi:tetratricopeptide (TPR) repeat protein